MLIPPRVVARGDGRLRVNSEDGSIPNDNPYADAPNGVRCGTLKNEKAGEGSVAPSGTVCRATFARRLRNPFRMTFDPDTSGTSFRINDVGSSGWEEIDGGEGAVFNGVSGPCLTRSLDCVRRATGCRGSGSNPAVTELRYPARAGWEARNRS